MAACVRHLSFVIIGLLAAPGVSRAQTAAEEAARWGLLGAWKIDCAAPTSVENGELSYVVREGALFLDRRLGEAADSNPVLSAQPVRDGAIDLRVEFPSLHQTREFVLAKGSGNRARTISNRNVETNDYSIRHGRIVGSSRPTPWQTRCDAAADNPATTGSDEPERR